MTIDLFTRQLMTKEMSALENQGESIGISKMMMMENAGGSIAKFVYNHFFGQCDRGYSNAPALNVLVVAGTGNNGGDAFVAARHLCYWKGKFRITVALIGDERNIRSQEAKKNWEVLGRLQVVRKLRINTIEDLSKFQIKLKEAAVVVSAIFGTGFKGRPRRLQGLVISKMNENQSALIVSVDVPSGLEADSGRCKLGVDSDVTISMHGIKKGMLCSQTARQKCGEIIVENIGLPF